MSAYNVQINYVAMVTSCHTIFFSFSECGATNYGDSCSKSCSCITANTADCNNTNGDCTCKTGWNGTICDVNIDECLNSTICDGIPDSTCQDSMGSYDCVCITGYKKNSSNLCESKTQFCLYNQICPC